MNANSLSYVYDQNVSALHTMAALNDATNTDLRPYMKSGGKLILWHGGSDPAINYRSTTEYYKSAVAVVGGQPTADSFMRYYIAPGVNHTSGGVGADTVDLLGALDAWVESGNAPGTQTATKVVSGSTALSRPLCVYPQYPRYTGRANDAEAAKLASNFTCTLP
jgi:hypothetical protein